MKNLKEQIPLAIEAIKTLLADGNKVDKEYNGYVSSLGASILQSGLLPTLSFFSDNTKKTNKLLKAILYVLDRSAVQRTTLLNYTIKQIDKREETKPDDPSYSFTRFSHNTSNEKRITKQIMEASVAIKLALRTFKQEKF